MSSEDFGRKIRGYLQKVQRSEAYLAQELGRSTGQFNRWMNGKNRVPYDVVREICHFFQFEKLQEVELFRLAGYPFPTWVEDLIRQPSLQSESTSYTNEDEWNIKVIDSNTLVFTYRDLAQQLLEAEHTVCDITWGLDIPSYLDEEEEAYQTYLDTIHEVCRKGIIYREIMTFNDAPDEFFDRADSMLAQNLITYNLRYYDVSLKNLPPLMTFAITDDQKVCCSFYHWPYLPIEGEIRLSIKQPQIVRLFQDYFNAIWKGAQRIKEGDKIYWSEYEELKQRLLNG